MFIIFQLHKSNQFDLFYKICSRKRRIILDILLNDSKYFLTEHFQ